MNGGRSVKFPPRDGYRPIELLHGYATLPIISDAMSETAHLRGLFTNQPIGGDLFIAPGICFLQHFAVWERPHDVWPFLFDRVSGI
jgi:hypothetical protein